MSMRKSAAQPSTSTFAARVVSNTQSICKIPGSPKSCASARSLPGEELFGFVDDKGQAHDIKSDDVNAYLQQITGQEFTAKDFRTWAGTVLAARALQEFEQVDSQARRKKNVVKAVEAVAEKLGNTKAVCRKCYIHPHIIDSYMDGTLIKQLHQRGANA